MKSLAAELRAKNAEFLTTPKPEAVILTGDQFAVLYGEWLQFQTDRGLDEWTIISLAGRRSILVRWLDGEPITIAAMRNFFSHIARHYRGSSVLKTREIISRFFNWAVSEGAILINPLQFVSMPKLVKSVKRRPFTHEEYLKLRDHSLDLYGRWVVVATYCLGLRTSGVAWLKWADVNVEERRVTTLERKTRRMGIQSVIPYVPWGDVERCINELHLERNDLDDSYPGAGFVSKVVALRYASSRRTIGVEFWRTCKRAGVEPLGLHSLRRAFCSTIANYSGLNHVAAMKMTGHKHFETYAQYVTVDDQVLADGLVKAFAKVEGKRVAMKQLKDAVNPPVNP